MRSFPRNTVTYLHTGCTGIINTCIVSDADSKMQNAITTRPEWSCCLYYCNWDYMREGLRDEVRISWFNQDNLKCD